MTLMCFMTYYNGFYFLFIYCGSYSIYQKVFTILFFDEQVFTILNYPDDECLFFHISWQEKNVLYVSNFCDQDTCITNSCMPFLSHFLGRKKVLSVLNFYDQDTCNTNF